MKTNSTGNYDKTVRVVKKSFLIILTVLFIVVAISIVPTKKFKSTNNFLRADQAQNATTATKIIPINVVAGNIYDITKYGGTEVKTKAAFTKEALKDIDNSSIYFTGKTYTYRYTKVPLAVTKNNSVVINDGGNLYELTRLDEQKNKTVKDYTLLELQNFNICKGHLNSDGTNPYTDGTYDFGLTSCQVLEFERTYKTDFSGLKYFVEISETEEEDIKVILDLLSGLSSSATRILIYNPSDKVADIIDNNANYSKLNRTYTEAEATKFINRISRNTAKFYNVKHPVLVLNEKSEIDKLYNKKVVSRLHKLNVSVIVDISNSDVDYNLTNDERNAKISETQEMMKKLLINGVDGFVSHYPETLNRAIATINTDATTEFNKTTTTTTKKPVSSSSTTKKAD